MPTLAIACLSLSLLLLGKGEILFTCCGGRSLLCTIRACSCAHFGIYTLFTGLCIRHWSRLWFKVLRAALSCNRESKKRGFVVVNLRRKNDVFVVSLEEYVGKRRTKVGSIKSIGALRDVHLLTLAAIDLDSILTKLVAHCIWHDFMLVTKGARAVTISTLKVLSVNIRQS